MSSVELDRLIQQQQDEEYRRCLALGVAAKKKRQEDERLKKEKDAAAKKAAEEAAALSRQYRPTRPDSPMPDKKEIRRRRLMYFQSRMPVVHEVSDTTLKIAHQGERDKDLMD